jgi:hypothetical protein
MNPPILNPEFQHPADGWYQVEALGNHPHRAAGVVQVIDAEAARSIVDRFNTDAAAGQLRHGHEMLIDHEHFSDQPDQETRAYGWLQELQNRADGIYGRLRWTGTGQAAVDGGDYRFFSTEYDPQDLMAVDVNPPPAKNKNPAKLVRPLRLAGLTLTNMNNNRGQKPITNRSGPGVPPVQTQSENPGNPSATPTQTKHQAPTMNSICTLLGLSATADEAALHAAVTRLLNRADIAPDALAALRAEHQTLTDQNQLLLGEQSETLLDSCGVRDERLRNRLQDGLKLLKNRQERLNYLADFGYQPGEPPRPASVSRVLNRGAGPAREFSTLPAGDGDQAVALKIQNRASELHGKGLKYDTAWNQARREVLGKN